MAQVADRILRRVSGFWLAAEPANGLVEKTLNGLERCGRLIPMQQGVVAAERVRLQIEQVLQQRRKRFAAVPAAAPAPGDVPRIGPISI